MNNAGTCRRRWHKADTAAFPPCSPILGYRTVNKVEHRLTLAERCEAPLAVHHGMTDSLIDEPHAAALDGELYGEALLGGKARSCPEIRKRRMGGRRRLGAELLREINWHGHPSVDLQPFRADGTRALDIPMGIRRFQRPRTAASAMLEMRGKGATLRLPARQNSKAGHQPFPVGWSDRNAEGSI